MRFASVDGKGDEFVPVVVEAIAVALGQELGIAGDHAQRLLQVVGDDVGVLLQIDIRALEFDDGAGE